MQLRDKSFDGEMADIERVDLPKWRFSQLGERL